MTGRVEAVCVSNKKGEKKAAKSVVRLVCDHGIQGDAHAGEGHRQISLLTAEDLDTMREKGRLDLKPGDLAENVVVSGMDLTGLGLGSRLRLGAEAEISITQRGKVCHTRCAIYLQTGDCIMPRLGLFARVLKNGDVAPGDPVDVLELIARNVLQVVVLTISDRCSRCETVDTAGPAVERMIQQNLRSHIYKREIVPDEHDTIASRIRHFCDGHSIDLVITAGGTGFSPRDVTPEAVSEVIERPAPGLDEAMRAASFKTTPHAMLSRGVSGIRGSTLILSLPGSELAAVENLAVVLPALGHGLSKLRGNPSNCGRRAEDQ